MTEWFGCGVLWYPSVLCFDIDLTSQNLWIPSYNKCQHFLYETIPDLRNKEMNDVEIANWLNDKSELVKVSGLGRVERDTWKTV